MLSRLLSPRGLLMQVVLLVLVLLALSKSTDSTDSKSPLSPLGIFFKDDVCAADEAPSTNLYDIKTIHEDGHPNDSNDHRDARTIKNNTLVAARNIPAGTTILTEEPLLLLPHGRKPLHLWTSYISLPPKSRARFLNLPISETSVYTYEMMEITWAAHTLALGGSHWPEGDPDPVDQPPTRHSGGPSSGENNGVGFPEQAGEARSRRAARLANQLLHLARIHNTNALPLAGPMFFSSAVLPRMSALAHSCRPNVEASFDDASRVGVLRSVRAVAAGEELTADWVDGAFLMRGARRARLERIGKGGCACEVCGGEKGGANAGKRGHARGYGNHRGGSSGDGDDPFNGAEVRRARMHLLRRRLELALYSAYVSHTPAASILDRRTVDTLLAAGTELARLQDEEGIERVDFIEAHEALVFAHLTLRDPPAALHHLQRLAQTLHTALGPSSQWTRDASSYLLRAASCKLPEQEPHGQRRDAAADMPVDAGMGGDEVPGGRDGDGDGDGNRDWELEFERLVSVGLTWRFARGGGELFGVWAGRAGWRDGGE